MSVVTSHIDVCCDQYLWCMSVVTSICDVCLLWPVTLMYVCCDQSLWCLSVMMSVCYDQSLWCLSVVTSLCDVCVSVTVMLICRTEDFAGEQLCGQSFHRWLCSHWRQWRVRHEPAGYPSPWLVGPVSGCKSWAVAGPLCACLKTLTTSKSQNTPTKCVNISHKTLTTLVWKSVTKHSQHLSVWTLVTKHNTYVSEHQSQNTHNTCMNISYKTLTAPKCVNIGHRTQHWSVWTSATQHSQHLSVWT